MSDRTCTLPECSDRHYARGLCKQHYDQGYRDGWLPPAIPAPNFLPDENGCWVWQRATSDHGYGHTPSGDLAHRWVFEAMYGPVPDGYELDHLCRNRSCVNPDHLDPVTPWVNQMRSHSPAAINARKTHCDQGHPYTPENTYLRPDRKGRQCRECIRIRSHRLNERRKAARRRKGQEAA